MQYVFAAQNYEVCITVFVILLLPICVVAIVGTVVVEVVEVVGVVVVGVVVVDVVVGKGVVSILCLDFVVVALDCALTSQITPAASLMLQLWLSQGRCLQSAKLLSDPEHTTSSKNIFSIFENINLFIFKTKILFCTKVTENLFCIKFTDFMSFCTLYLIRLF